jgi:hypothetical protein
LYMSKSRINTAQDIFLPEYRIETVKGCWEWQGKITRHGYGIFMRNRKTVLVHREILQVLTGPLGDLLALHKCDNPPCFNPAHLFRGSQKDNIQDMISKGRATKKNGWVGKSGVFGVVWVKRRSMWRVIRREDGRMVRYGDFKELSDAKKLNAAIIKAKGGLANDYV